MKKLKKNKNKNKNHFFHSDRSWRNREHNSFSLAYLVISLLFCFILIGVSFLFASSSSSAYPEKLSAYECGGFDPFDDARSRFDIRFYLVSILFIKPLHKLKVSSCVLAEVTIVTSNPRNDFVFLEIIVTTTKFVRDWLC